MFVASDRRVHTVPGRNRDLQSCGGGKVDIGNFLYGHFVRTRSSLRGCQEAARPNLVFSASRALMCVQLIQLAVSAMTRSPRDIKIVARKSGGNGPGEHMRWKIRLRAVAAVMLKGVDLRLWTSNCGRVEVGTGTGQLVFGLRVCHYAVSPFSARGVIPMAVWWTLVIQGSACY